MKMRLSIFFLVALARICFGWEEELEEFARSTATMDDDDWNEAEARWKEAEARWKEAEARWKEATPCSDDDSYCESTIQVDAQDNFRSTISKWTESTAKDTDSDDDVDIEFGITETKPTTSADAATRRYSLKSSIVVTHQKTVSSFNGLFDFIIIALLFACVVVLLVLVWKIMDINKRRYTQ